MDSNSAANQHYKLQPGPHDAVNVKNYEKYTNSQRAAPSNFSPEVNFDKVDKIRGLDITIVTTSISKEGTLELLKEFNFPIINKKNWGKNGKKKRNWKK